MMTSSRDNTFILERMYLYTHRKTKGANPTFLEVFTYTVSLSASPSPRTISPIYGIRWDTNRVPISAWKE